MLNMKSIIGTVATSCWWGCSKVSFHFSTPAIHAQRDHVDVQSQCYVGRFQFCSRCTAQKEIQYIPAWSDAASPEIKVTTNWEN